MTKAGMLQLGAVKRVLHKAEFETVLGRLSFDDKGDVEGFEPFVWFVWRDEMYKLAKSCRIDK